MDSVQDNSEKKMEKVAKNQDILWGAAQIGPAIGLTKRQAFHLIQQGKLKSVHRIGDGKRGGRLYASRKQLLKELLEEAGGVE